MKETCIRCKKGPRGAVFNVCPKCISEILTGENLDFSDELGVLSAIHQAQERSGYEPCCLRKGDCGQTDCLYKILCAVPPKEKKTHSFIEFTVVTRSVFYSDMGLCY